MTNEDCRHCCTETRRVKCQETMRAKRTVMKSPLFGLNPFTEQNMASGGPYYNTDAPCSPPNCFLPLRTALTPEQCKTTVRTRSNLAYYNCRLDYIASNALTAGVLAGPECENTGNRVNCFDCSWLDTVIFGKDFGYARSPIDCLVNNIFAHLYVGISMTSSEKTLT